MSSKKSVFSKTNGNTLSNILSATSACQAGGMLSATSSTRKMKNINDDDDEYITNGGLDADLGALGLRGGAKKRKSSVSKKKSTSKKSTSKKSTSKKGKKHTGGAKKKKSMDKKKSTGKKKSTSKKSRKMSREEVGGSDEMTYFQKIGELVKAAKGEQSDLKDGPGFRTVLGEVLKSEGGLDNALKKVVELAKSGELKRRAEKKQEEIIAKRKKSSAEKKAAKAAAKIAN